MKKQKDPDIAEAVRLRLADDRTGLRRLHSRLRARYGQRRSNELLAAEKKRQKARATPES